MSGADTHLVLASGAVSADDLLRFWVSLGILLIGAKVMGRAARRIGQPPVVGELTAGVLLGPTLLGRVAPDAGAWLFPSEGNVSAMIAAVAWLGVVMLLAVTGFEIDLRQLRRLGRAAVTTSTFSLVVPIALGLVLGYALPVSFAGDNAGNSLPLFMGVALGISALPVVAKVLRELHLAKGNVGQIMLAAAMVNDVVGWALLGVVAGIVGSQGSPLVGLATALAGAVAVIVGGLTIGQRAVDGLLRSVRRSEEDGGSLLGVSVIIIIAAGALTQAIGVEAVLGAFVAGVVLSRSPLGGSRIERPLSQMADQILAPVFFATAGLQVDLFGIVQPDFFGWTLAIIGVAIVGKLLGGWMGARLGGFSHRDSLAVGVGLNARGALEIVVASVGLSLGVLSGEAYSAVVVMAVVTSLMAPPMLTRILGLTPPPKTVSDGTEPSRIFAGMRTALIPTRGGGSSVLAGRVADAVLPAPAALTALTVHPAAQDSQAGRAAARTLSNHVSRRMRWRDHVAADSASAVVSEAQLGYDLLALGATAPQPGEEPVSEQLARMVTYSPIPVLLIRTAHGVDATKVPLRSIAVGASGGAAGQAAEELGLRLAACTDGELTLVHIIDRPPTPPSEPRRLAAVSQATQFDEAEQIVAPTRQVADAAGVAVEVELRRSRSVAEDLIDAASAAGATLLVVGAKRRGGTSFLGHTVAHLLAEAPMSVAVVILPPGQASDH